MIKIFIAKFCKAGVNIAVWKILLVDRMLIVNFWFIYPQNRYGLVM